MQVRPDIRQPRHDRQVERPHFVPPQRARVPQEHQMQPRCQRCQQDCQRPIRFFATYIPKRGRDPSGRTGLKLPAVNRVRPENLLDAQQLIVFRHAVRAAQ